MNEAQIVAEMSEWTPAGVAGLVITIAMASAGLMFFWYLLFGQEMKDGGARALRRLRREAGETKQ